MQRRSLGGALSVLALLLVSAAPVHADRISRAAISVEASSAGADAKMDLTWTADEARSALTVYLHNGLTPSSVTVGGKSVQPSSAAVPGSRLTAWTLPAAVPAGETAVAMTVAVPAGDLTDLEVGGDGGTLLPGTGWFPRVAVSGDETLPHTVSFRLPDGWTGVAAGSRGADGTWTASTGRPYAVWGAYRESSEKAKGNVGEERTFKVWRRSKADVPSLTTVAGLLHALEVGLGQAEGSGDWKVVEAGRTAGGLRTLFHGGSVPEQPRLRERGIAGALAAGFWTDAFSFRGPLAAFLSRSVAMQLGDVAVSAASRADDLNELERATIGSRRDAFVASAAKDRTLEGLVDLSEDGDRLLPTRGALVAHTLAEYWQTRSRWLVDVAAFRDLKRGQEAGWDTFSPGVFWKTRELVEPLLTTTKLPDFRLVSQSVQETKMGGRRYAVEVTNVGVLGATTELATLDAAHQVIHSVRVYLEPGENRVMKFADPELVARVAVEPRGVVPQADIKRESADVEPLKPLTPEQLAARIPSFPFDQDPAPRAAKGLSLDLGEIHIENFNGWVVPYSTHHGPSGACLLGKCSLTIRPAGDGATAFLEAMDISEEKYPEARELWIRFPLSVWDEIRPQLGEPVSETERHEVVNRQNWIYSFSFETYFYEGNEAQVPPAGSELVVFRTGIADEWKGYVREPLPDATVFRRLWNHLGSTTIWEDRR